MAEGGRGGGKRGFFGSFSAKRDLKFYREPEIGRAKNGGRKHLVTILTERGIRNKAYARKRPRGERGFRQSRKSTKKTGGEQIWTPKGVISKVPKTLGVP